MSEVREFLIELCKTEGWDTDKEDLAEALTECGKQVWSDKNTDQHRWYIRQDVVTEINGIFIKYTDYIITGDNGMADMDLEYDLDAARIVQKKTREVIETYYE